jgi:hypothetical protein
VRALHYARALGDFFFLRTVALRIKSFGEPSWGILGISGAFVFVRLFSEMFANVLTLAADALLISAPHLLAPTFSLWLKVTGIRSGFCCSLHFISPYSFHSVLLRFLLVVCFWASLLVLY